MLLALEDREDPDEEDLLLDLDPLLLLCPRACLPGLQIQMIFIIKYSGNFITNFFKFAIFTGFARFKTHKFLKILNIQV